MQMGALARFVGILTFVPLMAFGGCLPLIPAVWAMALAGPLLAVVAQRRWVRVVASALSVVIGVVAGGLTMLSLREDYEQRALKRQAVVSAFLAAHPCSVRELTVEMNADKHTFEIEGCGRTEIYHAVRLDPDPLGRREYKGVRGRHDLAR